MINSENVMCMCCSYVCYYTDGRIECEWEDDEGKGTTELMKNFDCGDFDFNPVNLIEFLVRLMKEVRNK